MQLSDYYFPGEASAEAQATAKEFLALDLAADEIQWPEERRHAGSKSKHREAGGTVAELGEGRPPIPFGLRSGQQALTLATLVCIISCFISYLIARSYVA